MVLVSSFPYTINWSQEHVPAILQMAHSSQDEGWALAQVLFGDYNPGGHTVVTWPASLEQLPPMMDYDIRHGRTYMYAKGTPLYAVRPRPELHDVRLREAPHRQAGSWPATDGSR